MKYIIFHIYRVKKEKTRYLHVKKNEKKKLKKKSLCCPCPGVKQC